MTNKRRWSMLIVGPGHGLACPPGEEFRGSPAYYERILVEESVEGGLDQRQRPTARDRPVCAAVLGQCSAIHQPRLRTSTPPPILAFSWTAGRGPCCKGR